MIKGKFRAWYYTVSHATLLIRSPKRFPVTDRKQLISRVRSIVCHDTKDPLETLNSVTQLIKSQGKSLEVTPAAYITSKLDPTKDLVF